MDHLRTDRDKVDKILLAAELANFAYTSANPTARISIEDNEAKESLHRSLPGWGSKPQSFRFHTGQTGHPGHFARFASHSWWRSKTNQFRWFRSHAYIYDYFEKKSNVHRIVVAFRGTWNNDAVTNQWYNQPGQNVGCWATYGPPAWYNWLARTFTPANIGFSDIYYDIMVIRIPYTTGTVWKWFAYWGALVLERTSCLLFRFPPLSWLFHPSRMSATDWISRPNHNRTRPRPEFQSEGHTESQTTPEEAPEEPLGDAHLGFWSLWASPEGFAGYDGDGNLDNSSPGVILGVKAALDRCRDARRPTEILVVGHSLGGAVSCFAALDLARRLQEWNRKDVSIFHTTFGAPPIGDTRFQEHFDSQFNQPGRPLESWSIFHEQDLVASCFAYCGSHWLFGRLGWWGDWRGVGHRVRLSDQIQISPAAGSHAQPDEAPLDEAPLDEVLDDATSDESSSDNALHSATPQDNAPPNGASSEPWWRPCLNVLSRAGQGVLTVCKGLLNKTRISWLASKLVRPLVIIALVLLLLVLYILSWVAVIAAFRYYLSPWYWCYRRKNVTKPSANWGRKRTPRDPLRRPQGGELDFEHHGLTRYIHLIRTDRFQRHAVLVRWVDGIGEDAVAEGRAYQDDPEGEGVGGEMSAVDSGFSDLAQ